MTIPLEDQHLPPSNISTDQSPWPFWALERWIRALIAAVFSRGGGNVVWRPGGVTSGNVYATWPEVVAAVAALQGMVTIGVDVDLGAAIIPVGAWDLRPAGVSGPVFLVNASKTDAAPFVTIAHAAVTIHGLSGLEDVQIDNHSTSHVITASGADRVDFYLRGTGVIFQSIDAAGASFLHVTGGGGNPFAPGANLYIQDFSFVSTLDGGTNAIQVAGGAAFLDMFVDDNAIFDTNQLVTAAGNAQVFVTAAPDPGIPNYGAQAGAPNTIPFKLVKRGVAVIDGATGKTLAITAFVNANTRIFCNQRVAAGDATTVRYAALAADRVNGNPGSFKIAALTAAGGGAVNAGDTSTIEYECYTT